VIGTLLRQATNARPSSSFSSCRTLISHVICWPGMFHPILATQRCAASCSRIDLIPSRLLAALWFAWLALIGGVTLFAVALPWPARLAICVAVVAPGVHCIRSLVLLKGRKAVRAIEWFEEGEFDVWLGPALTRYPATLGAGSFRLGVQLWVLRFATPVGACPVLISAGVHQPSAFRRLSRCLNRSLRRASGRSSRPAVTIRPKV